MTDPGWDIPGVPRDEPACPQGSGAAAGASSVSAGSLSGAVRSALAGDAAAAGGSGRRGGSARGLQAAREAAAAATGAFSEPARAARAAQSAFGGQRAGVADGQSSGPGPARAASAAGSDQPAPDGRQSGAERRSRADSSQSAAKGSQSSGRGSAGAASAAGSGRPAADGPAADSRQYDADSGATFEGPAAALAALDAALNYLAHADPGSWPEGAQADCLRALAVAESRQAAAHARVLSAFSVPGGGLAGDGHRSPRIWLTWQTQATRRAAAASAGWMRRLAAHPVLAGALAAGQVSLSWARQLADWTDRLPEHARPQADDELLTAAGRGAALSELFGLAEAQRREHARPDGDDDDGFSDRSVRIATTFEGAGRLEGDLTARCAAALNAVIGSLARPRGPEDDRTVPQRQHDALEEACLRLLAAGCLPARAGQPVRLELGITLAELAASTSGIGCDALIQPVITGHLDYNLLATLTTGQHSTATGQHSTATGQHSTATGQHSTATGQHGTAGGPDSTTGRPDDSTGGTGGTSDMLPSRVIEQAIALLSGPAGAAALLRRRAGGGPAAPVSLLLDIAAGYDTIPVHLRRAVRRRDRHCTFPGCDIPADGCDVHHIKHRKDGGRHALANLTLLCRFHHQIAIHRWGWTITLHPDGTTTAISPDRAKTLHSHIPRATTPAA